MLSVCASSHVLPLCDLKDCRPPGLNPSLLCLLHWQVDSLPLIFSNGSVVKSPPSGNAVDASSIPGLGRSPGGGHGNLLQYSCLGNPMDRGAWWAAVHGVAKSQTWLSDFALTFHFHTLEKEMATHSSVLAWRSPGTGEPGGLPSMGLHRVGHDWSDLAVAVAYHLP